MKNNAHVEIKNVGLYLVTYIKKMWSYIFLYSFKYNSNGIFPSFFISHHLKGTIQSSTCISVKLLLLWAMLRPNKKQFRKKYGPRVYEE